MADVLLVMFLTARHAHKKMSAPSAMTTSLLLLVTVSPAIFKVVVVAHQMTLVISASMDFHFLMELLLLALAAILKIVNFAKRQISARHAMKEQQSIITHVYSFVLT